MKRLLTKLLLALLLVLNPVAVLASGFHDVAMTMDQMSAEAPCHPADHSSNFSEPSQHDGSNCEMPCCEDSECLEQGICIIQFNSDVVAQTTLRFSPPFEHCGWGAFSIVVPDRELPPENPPPIDL